MFRRGGLVSFAYLDSPYSYCSYLCQESYERAKSILKTHSKEHKALADALMKYETLDANDIKSILEGRTVDKNS